MFINFAKKLFEYLISNEFSYIKQDDDSLVYNTEAFSLYKDKGSVLYIVSVINASLCPLEKFSAMIKKFGSLLDGEKSAQVIIMNVIVDDADNKLSNSYSEDFGPGKKSYVFTYNVNLDAKKLLVNRDQPDLLGLTKTIENALCNYNENYVNGTHLTSLQDEIIDNYSLNVKSDNSLLTLCLILLNAAVWALMEFSGSSGDSWTLISFGALTNDLVVNQREYFRLVSSVFVHAGLLHLVNNCLSIYIFASRIEKFFGKLSLIVIFLITAIVGNLFTIYFIPNISCGASGGVFGLLGAILAVSYRTGRSFGGLSPYVIVIICIYSIGMGFVMPGVNNFAHIGGFIAGMALGKLLKLSE